MLLYLDDWAWNGTPVPMLDGMENSRMPALPFEHAALHRRLW
ncbi:hypothetical protein Enr13x_04220 [Stieleria neptunia]|uniref:Uncharacterized protein n=1 Tax=Stieleria neptunia TaxID=2527979 RepID=A0A518HID9_9BACT|nr:hypothetical protein [Stieleria neptunia]QDV40616.1 hypothetical protein Enr13x_04220 [Stieleria neptunia]